MDGTKSEQQVLHELKSLVEGNSKLEKYKSLLDDEFLLHFVRGKKCDTAKAFKTLENYFAVREKHVDIFAEIRPSNAIVLDKGIPRVLKRRDEFGRAVIVWDLKKWDQSMNVEPNDFTRGLILILEELWKEKDVETQGIVNIIDHAFLEFRHLTPWTPPTISRTIKLVINNFPLRYADIYVVNPGRWTHWLMKIVIALLPAKLGSRVMILRKEEIGRVRDLLKFEDSDLPQTVRKDWTEENLRSGTDDEDDIWDMELEARIRNKDAYYANMTRLIKSPSLFQ